MVDSLEGWAKVFSVKDNAVGEVAAVEGNVFEVYLYPPYYPRVRIGTVMVVNSEGTKAIGIVVRLSHRSRLGSFNPLHRTRAEIEQAYPDLERYHNFVCTVAYTSHLDGNKLIHSRASMPRLHDLVYLVNDRELLHSFFNSRSFDFLRYYIMAGAGPLEVKELFQLHAPIFRKMNVNELARSIVKSSVRAGVSQPVAYLEELNEILGEAHE